MAKIATDLATDAREVTGSREPSRTVGVGNQCGEAQKLKINLPYDPATPLHGTCPEDLASLFQR